MLNLKFLIFVLCGTLVSSYSFDVDSEKIHNKSRTIVLAIDRILADSISKQSNLLFICAKTNSQSRDELKPNELLNDFLQFMSNETKIALVIDADDFKYQIIRNYSLLIVDGFESFWKIYGKMTKAVRTETYFDSDVYFVIVLTNSEDNHHETVNRILSSCWRDHVANVVILVPTRNYSRILLYTYFPYSHEHCEEVTPIVRNYFENNSFKLNLSHFPEKCGNFHQCPLYVAATDDPPYTFLVDDGMNKTSYFGGIDALVVKEISRRLNFKMVVLPYYGGFFHEDHYFTVNISVCGSYPLQKYEKQNTIPYTYDTTLFLIPPGKPYSSLVKLFFPFKMEVWIGICTSFLAMVIWTVILKFTSKKKCDYVIGHNNDAPLLNLFSIILGGSMTTRQLPQRNFARTILVILLLATMILRNAYLGNLFNFLRIQKRMEPLYFKQDIYDSDVKIYMSASRKIQFSSPSVEKRTVTQALDLDNLRDDYFDGVYFYLKNIVDYYNFINLRKPKILMTKDYLALYQILMWVRKHSCLKKSFDHQISALHSSGLVEYWRKSFTKTVRDTEEKDPKTLKIDQFTGIIVICVVMYALSFLIFLLESMTLKFEKIKIFMDCITLK